MQSIINLPETRYGHHVVATVSGWGMTYEEYPDGEFSTILQKSDMTILDQDECQKLHRLNTIGVENICGFKNSFSGVCTVRLRNILLPMTHYQLPTKMCA